MESIVERLGGCGRKIVVHFVTGRGERERIGEMKMRVKGKFT